MDNNLNFDSAVQDILRHEGGYSDQPNDKGGATKYGISLRYLKSLGSNGDINNDGSIDDNDIKVIDINKATAFYRRGFWDKYGYDRINNASVAEKIFDLSVNMGPETAHKLIQKAVNLGRLSNTLKEDGILGQKTIDAVNSLNADRLLLRLNGVAISRYIDIAERDPTQKIFIDGWLKRAWGGV